MATVRPFCGLRFSPSAGPIDSLVAPPYDVLSEQERAIFAGKSEHNIVHLTLPEGPPDPRSKFVKYANSGATLQRWRTEGTLKAEERPSYYRYTQTFDLPGSEERRERIALIATIKVEPYEKGVVLPHEQTFPKHKEDRLRLLEATRAHLECIYGLFEDEALAVFKLIKGARGTTVEEVTTDDEVRHLVERIDDPATCQEISRAIQPKKVWIADGHHRYETACTFRHALGDSLDPVPEDYMLMALSSISDPGLVLLPTHRILNKVQLSSAEIASRMKESFTLEPCKNEDLLAEISGRKAFGLALPAGEGLVLMIEDLKAVIDRIPGPESERLKSLDVTILHRLIFEQILGLSGVDFFSYTRDEREAIEAVERGAAASFLMNPPTVEDMRLIALGGEKMPQKSTYYYPKILSGLVLWSLNDFVA